MPACWPTRSRAAAKAAYRPVRQPIEGTMLTVIREMAETAEAHRDRPLDEAIDAVLEAAAGTVVRTESMLDVLREAHVVDAGAAGLLEYARGAVAGLPRRVPAAARGRGRSTRSRSSRCTSRSRATATARPI